MRRFTVALTLAMILLLVGDAGAAWASWAGGGSGAGSSRAVSMPAGATPSVSVSGRNVVVTWAQVSLPDSTAVTDYRVDRSTTGGLVQTIGAPCHGTISGLTCTEAAVPVGTWKYASTPQWAQWLGARSAYSSTVTVDPPSLTFSSPTTVPTLPATLNGSLASFITGETVTVRLDDPTSGTVLSGTVTSSPIPFSGGSTFSVTIPVLTTAGAHTVYAVGSQGSQASAGITILPNDTVAPTVSAAVVAKSAGGAGGFVRQGGQYYAYAQVTDSGSPASGVDTVRANLSIVTTGATNVAMTAGSYTLEGVSYNYRSAVQTATNPQTAGPKSFSITAADVAGNGGTTGGFSVTVDNTAPTGTDVQTTNIGGGTTGLPESGDTITLTFSEPMDPYDILTGWDGSATTMTLRMSNNGGGDRVQFRDAGGSTLPLGTVQLGSTGYTTQTRSFTGSAMVMSGNTLTVTLGTPDGAVTTAPAASTATWDPSTAATDRAGNACSTATVTESGPADKQF